MTDRPNDDWLHQPTDKVCYVAAIMVDGAPATNQLAASEALARLGFPDWDVDIDAQGFLVVCPDLTTGVEVAQILREMRYYETMTEDGSVVLEIEMPS